MYILYLADHVDAPFTACTLCTANSSAKWFNPYNSQNPKPISGLTSQSASSQCNLSVSQTKANWEHWVMLNEGRSPEFNITHYTTAWQFLQKLHLWMFTMQRCLLLWLRCLYPKLSRAEKTKNVELIMFNITQCSQLGLVWDMGHWHSVLRQDLFDIIPQQAFSTTILRVITKSMWHLFWCSLTLVLLPGT